MRRLLITTLVTLVATVTLGAAERINHEGRILGPAPSVVTPTVFNTPEADAIVSAMQIMPRTSAWNEDVSGASPLGNSTTMLNNIIADLIANPGDPPNPFTNRRRVVVFQEMNYVLVPNTQPLVDIDFFYYADESDDLKPAGPGNNPPHIGSWPIPSNMPIETWPTGDGLVNTAQGLVNWQQSGVGGDRHSIVVMPGTGYIWETWTARLTTGWRASNGAKFPLTTNDPRPATWTSGDAAGLPMFPALVRFDECERGVVEHAMRIVVKRSRDDYLYPASHQAGDPLGVNYPAMGQRVRLKPTFTIPGTWSRQEQAVAVALMKYGALVADNGNFFSISICPDHRWPGGCWDHFSTGASAGSALDISNFEVIATTDANTGPRTGTPPTANANGDQTVTLAAATVVVNLNGSATNATSTTWMHYDAANAPAAVIISNASILNPTVTFSAPGIYTLRLKAADATHTPAYDALVVTVLSSGGSNPTPTLTALSPAAAVSGAGGFTMTLTGTNLMPASQVTWSGQTNLAVNFISSSQVTVQVPGSYLTSTGTPSITVTNPGPGGGASSTQTFSITAPSGSGGGGAAAESGGGCGLGSAFAAMLMVLMLAFRRLR